MSPPRPTPSVTFPALFILTALLPSACLAADVSDGKLNALNEKIEALRREYEATPWAADTPEEVGRLLKNDPGACAGFVRRALRYEPYAGVLRGGRGALAAGGGNSADLCGLLREMIAGASPAPPMRFAVAELTEKQATELVDRAARQPPARPATASPPDAKLPRADPAAERPRPPQPAASTRRQLLADLNVMAAQVEVAMKGALPQPSGSRRDAIKAARTHVWLLVQVGGEWRSLDPAAGLPLPQSGVRQVDRLPDDWNHTVTLKLEVERLDSGKLTRETLIERRLPSTEVAGRAVEVLTIPAELSVTKMIDPAAGDAGTFLVQAKGFKRFATAVSLPGEKPAAGKSFGLDGRTAAAEAQAGPTGIVAVDPFKRFPGRGAAPGAAPANTGELAGVWLTVTFFSPTTSADKVERALLDRIGPDARRQKKHEIAGAWTDTTRCAIALMQRHQLLVSTGTVGSVRAGRDAIETALLSQPVLQRAVELEKTPDAAKLQDTLKKLTPPSFPSDLIAVNDASLELAQARLMGHGACFVGVPNLYVRSESLDLSPDGAVVSRNTIDVARHELAVLAEPKRVWRTRLLHGLAASELEGRVLDEEISATSAARALRAAAAASGSGLKAVRAARDLDALPVAPDAKAVMASELRNGVALLVADHPSSPGGAAPPAAWWRVTRDGHVVAVGADGRGQAVTEGGMILTDVSIPQVKNCMTFVACLNKGVAGGGAMVQTAANCWSEQVKDVAKEVLDNALEQMIGDPFSDLFSGEDDADAPPPESGTIGHLRDPPFQEPDEQSYYDLYQQAREELEELKKNAQRVQDAIDDPLGQLPGVNEGQQAADAGAEIGNALGTRVYLLLAMGSDIARFASQPIADPPQQREP